MESNGSLIEINESVIKRSAESLPPNSSFHRLLGIASLYREAEMSPIFMYDEDNHLLYVVAKETFGKRLN